MNTTILMMVCLLAAPPATLQALLLHAGEPLHLALCHLKSEGGERRAKAAAETPGKPKTARLAPRTWRH